MKSYLSHLECTACKEIFSPQEVHGTCSICGKVLYARYNLKQVGHDLRRDDLTNRRGDMWRYFELLPVQSEENIVSLGEGFTPLIQADRLGIQLGCPNLLIKDEGVNPTASFKARGLSSAVSRAVELGISRFTIPSAGNAGGALAAYASRAGKEAHVFMPSDVPSANVDEVTVSGAKITLVDGLISDAGKASRHAAKELGLFDLSTLQEPYRAEGKKTMGYEIAEQLNWELPDAIVYPTGGGTGIVGIWKAFEEMETLGWITQSRPKMFCVQAAGCAPLVKAFHAGDNYAEPWRNAKTIASGLRVPAAIGDYLVLQALRDSNGSAITTTDNEIMRWVKEVARLEGVFMSPEGAATVSALGDLIESGKISCDDRVVLLNTGSGLKYLDLL